MQLNSTDFADLTIYSHSSLNVSTIKHGAIQIALVGYVINPLMPDDSNEEIIRKLAEKCSKQSEFFKESQVLSGRYVLLYKNPTSFIVSGDTCHLRQIYYGFEEEGVILTSSLKLYLNSFNYELRISEEKKAVVNSPLFLSMESAWYGDESADDRIKKLLPNHYLDILKKEKKRIPIFRHSFADEEQIMDHASLLLRNTFTALTNRYQLIQPLTGGVDSRILLAASKNYKDKIQYYVFDRPLKSPHDIWVPGFLSKKLGLNFNIINPGELRKEFLEEYQAAHLFPRVLSKTSHIQSHYDSKYKSDVINVNGNCSEIARFVYGTTEKKISFDMLLTFSQYQNRIPYFNEQLRKWYSEAGKFAEDYGISILHLQYWEQRIGNWHALWQFEQDIGVEEISPFNNRSLIDALLQIKPKRRKLPDFLFYQKLARHLWKDVLSVPINPDDNRIKNMFKGNTTITHLRLMVKIFMQKFT